jgi:hypothetical protein
MRRLVLALVLLIAVPTSVAASSRDPDAPRPTRRPAPPATQPVQIPPGLYRVTEVYAGDVVTRAGDVTSYATITRHQDTDTYARVLEQVATGVPSVYDGSAINGRRTLSDGALIAGTYYENYIFDGADFRPVSIVFFQDDSELARRRPSPAPTAAPSRGSPTATPSLRPVLAPSAALRATPAPTFGPVVIGVDPTRGGSVLDRIEVARGARYAFRVNVRGGALASWSLVAGVNDAYNAPGWHAAAEPLFGQWLRLAPMSESWTLALRVRVGTPSGALVERDGTIAVLVRSPAVVE